MRTKYVNEKKEEINKDVVQGNESTTKFEKKNYNPKTTAIFTNNYKHD